MHVANKYLDTRKAAIAALQDYPVMEHILATTDQTIADTYQDATTPASPRLDGTPTSGDPHAAETRIAATLDRIDVYRDRYHQACQYMDWMLPAWEALSDDDRFVLDAFFLADQPQEARIQTIADHYYIERDSAYRRKNRALDHLTTALYG